MAICGMLLIIVLLPMTGWSETRTCKDMAGRNVTICGDVERIVTTFKPATLSLFSLGLQGKIVGIDTGSKRDRLFQAVLPEVSGLTGVGSKSTGINFETVVSLAPDLVILYAQKDGIELAERLAVMKIPSIIILTVPRYVVHMQPRKRSSQRSILRKFTLISCIMTYEFSVRALKSSTSGVKLNTVSIMSRGFQVR